MTEVHLSADDLLTAELVANEIIVNQQPNLPPYVCGENCDQCGRGIPRWEYFAISGVTGRTLCACCADVTDDPAATDDNWCIGHSQGGEIICCQCGAQVWAPTPQLRHCRNCWPTLWKAMDDNTITIMQLIDNETYGR
jgi:hypothetical protein